MFIMNKFLKLVLLSSVMLSNVVAMEFLQDPFMQAQIVQKFINRKDCKIELTGSRKIKKLEYNATTISDEHMNDLLMLDLSELETLDFFNTLIDCNAVHALAEAIGFGRTPKLNYLDMTRSGINYDGVEAIVNAVIEATENCKLPKMEGLMLAGNNLSEVQEADLGAILSQAVEENAEKFSMFFWNFEE